jgi:hypothetical protein
MVTHPPLPDQQVSPTQVWATLSGEIQRRAIGLVAQLILQVVLARTHCEEEEQEANHAHQPEWFQNSF